LRVAKLKAEREEGRARATGDGSRVFPQNVPSVAVSHVCWSRRRAHSFGQLRFQSRARRLRFRHPTYLHVFFSLGSLGLILHPHFRHRFLLRSPPPNCFITFFIRSCGDRGAFDLYKLLDDPRVVASPSPTPAPTPSASVDGDAGGDFSDNGERP